ncbi:MAG: hypothetical protein ACTSUE_17770 [Promethearchaeota archaeon]
MASTTSIPPENALAGKKPSLDIEGRAGPAPSIVNLDEGLHGDVFLVLIGMGYAGDPDTMFDRHVDPTQGDIVDMMDGDAIHRYAIVEPNNTKRITPKSKGDPGLVTQVSSYNEFITELNAPFKGGAVPGDDDLVIFYIESHGMEDDQGTIIADFNWDGVTMLLSGVPSRDDHFTPADFKRDVLDIMSYRTCSIIVEACDAGEWNQLAIGNNIIMTASDENYSYCWRYTYNPYSLKKSFWNYLFQELATSNSFFQAYGEVETFILEQANPWFNLDQDPRMSTGPGIWAIAGQHTNLSGEYLGSDAFMADETVLGYGYDSQGNLFVHNPTGIARRVEIGGQLHYQYVFDGTSSQDGYYYLYVETDPGAKSSFPAAAQNVYVDPVPLEAGCSRIYTILADGEYESHQPVSVQEVRADLAETTFTGSLIDPATEATMSIGSIEMDPSIPRTNNKVENFHQQLQRHVSFEGRCRNEFAAQFIMDALTFKHNFRLFKTYIDELNAMRVTFDRYKQEEHGDPGLRGGESWFRYEMQRVMKGYDKYMAFWLNHVAIT